MSNRREFLIRATISSLAVATACKDQGQQGAATPASGTAGAPPVWGAGSGSGPAVSTGTFSEAEKLMQVTMTPAQRQQAADTWRSIMAPYLERRTGPKKFALADNDVPAMVWNPVLPGFSAGPTRSRVMPSATLPPLPAKDEDIAFASVAHQAHWIYSKKLTSTRLTNIYLERISRLNPKINAIITVTKDHALARAAQADREIAAGKYKGPLHGIPYGVKDLMDTAGIPTTYGAEPFKNRVPKADSAVVHRLNEAGAVLIAKLSLGALALNDIWFGGQTMNPWLLEEGASGSSAGPGAATAAALVAFSVGSETGGSIVAPAMRCGVTGFRPTFGKVARTGAMTLCWSLDKLGPMTRYVEDTMIVLSVIQGPDAGDPSSVPSHLEFDPAVSVRGLKVGYFPKWMNEAPATDVDRAALAKLKELGLTAVEVEFPDWPYSSLMPILFAEGAASFEELALTDQLSTLKVQVKDAWPNLFRQARFLSAVDMVQADRMRRRLAIEMNKIFQRVDVLLVPSLRDEMLTTSNFTGQPSLTLRAGFVSVGEARSDWAPDSANPYPKFSPPRRVPHGVTLLGRLFEDGKVAQVGLALEKALNVVGERPAGF